MLRKMIVLTGAAVIAACASRPPPPPPPPPPVVQPAEPDTSAEAIQPAAPQKPQQTDHGRFRVSVASLDTVAATVPWVNRMQAAGYRTEVLEVEIDGRAWQRVLLPGYATLEEARAVIPFVEQEFGITGVWVTSRLRAPVPPHRAEPAAPTQPRAPAAPAEPAEAAPAN